MGRTRQTDPMSKSKPKSKKRLPVLGWREWVRLPDLCSEQIKAKVDTGARTSSLHAFELELHETSHGLWVANFEIHPAQRSVEPSHRVEVPVSSFRMVRSSSGHKERRPVITTPIGVGEHRFDIELTLTSRDEMGFRMLLGRRALRQRFLVDAGRSHRQGDAG